MIDEQLREELNALSVEYPDLEDEAGHFYICEECGQAIDMRTVDKMERGFLAIAREPKFPEREELKLFAQGFAGNNAETVIAAVRARFEVWANAQDGGVDLKEQAPELYAALATQPLTPEDFNVFPTFEEAEA